jgi:DNA polymerase-1
VERKLKTGKKTKTGYSTDVAVLEELAREDPVPERILRYRMLSKLKSTYVDALAGLAGSDGRLHTHYAQAGTATGRLSSRDPNLQNIPIRDEEGRRIRAAFVAGPGTILVSADYCRSNSWSLTHLTGDRSSAERHERPGRPRRTRPSLRLKEDEANRSSESGQAHQRRRHVTA